MRAAASGSIKQEDEATGGKGGAALFTADLHSAGPAECIRFEFCFSSFVCVFLVMRARESVQRAESVRVLKREREREQVEWTWGMDKGSGRLKGCPVEHTAQRTAVW